MKIRLRKNWLSILAEWKVPQSRNCLWCDELMINYEGYGLCCHDVVYVIKSVWMSEYAIHFVIRRGVWGWQGGNCPYGFCLFFFGGGGGGLWAQSRTMMMMIIPQPHYGNDFATKNVGRKKMCFYPEIYMVIGLKLVRWLVVIVLSYK